MQLKDTEYELDGSRDRVQQQANEILHKASENNVKTKLNFFQCMTESLKQQCKVFCFFLERGYSFVIAWQPGIDLALNFHLIAAQFLYINLTKHLMYFINRSDWISSSNPNEPRGHYQRPGLRAEPPEGEDPTAGGGEREASETDSDTGRTTASEDPQSGEGKSFFTFSFFFIMAEGRQD